jgi:uncharacterized phage protein (TIGR01671 family)
MREIKFRAWTEKKMIFRGLNDRNWYTESNGGKIVKGAHPDDAHFLKMMQFTGLKDKNRVDIYERDICKIQLPLGGFWGNVKKEKIGVIEYNEDICGFVVRWEWSKNQHHIQINCDLEIEIIGNIFENSELLKP